MTLSRPFRETVPVLVCLTMTLSRPFKETVPMLAATTMHTLPFLLLYFFSLFLSKVLIGQMPVCVKEREVHAVWFHCHPTNQSSGEHHMTAAICVVQLGVETYRLHRLHGWQSHFA